MGSHYVVTKGQLCARLLLILSCEALATSAHLIVLPREASCSDTFGFPIRAVACFSSLSLFVWLCNCRKLERRSTSSSNSVPASSSCEEELELQRAHARHDEGGFIHTAVLDFRQVRTDRPGAPVRLPAGLLDSLAIRVEFPIPQMGAG